MKTILSFFTIIFLTISFISCDDDETVFKHEVTTYNIKDFADIIDSSMDSFLEKHKYTVKEESSEEVKCYINSNFSFADKEYYSLLSVLFKDNTAESINIELDTKDTDDNYYLQIYDSLSYAQNYALDINAAVSEESHYIHKGFNNYAAFKEWLDEKKEYIENTPEVEFGYSIRLIPLKSTAKIKQEDVDPDGVSVTIGYESITHTDTNNKPQREVSFNINFTKTSSLLH